MQKMWRRCAACAASASGTPRESRKIARTQAKSMRLASSLRSKGEEPSWCRLLGTAGAKTLRKVKSMTRTVARCLTIASAVSLHLAAPGTASADEAVIASPIPAVDRGTVAHSRLLRSLFTLEASYVPAVVATESEAQADEALYLRFAGPWLDLADREECEHDCGGESANQAPVVTTGVFQGLGALQIVGSFISPETRTVTVSGADDSPKLSLRVTPEGVGRGRGLVAVGQF
jgi:hypothetical protein